MAALLSVLNPGLQQLMLITHVRDKEGRKIGHQKPDARVLLGDGMFWPATLAHTQWDTALKATESHTINNWHDDSPCSEGVRTLMQSRALHGCCRLVHTTAPASTCTHTDYGRVGGHISRAADRFVANGGLWGAADPALLWRHLCCSNAVSGPYQWGSALAPAHDGQA